ncbi:hypothetical protein GUJ93_ZPchr0012g21784 [Zizania palustris]|uniref:Uncharacterized protein n=1 Tax=Zizania palustris TaxID=103762 RepID=A0A8J5WL06_ZIZPA|nr:hypothetical protein GUJ93_ZPchr0012g21784 [Zizania palustris]
MFESQRMTPTARVLPAVMTPSDSKLWPAVMSVCHLGVPSLITMADDLVFETIDSHSVILMTSGWKYAIY